MEELIAEHLVAISHEKHGFTFMWAPHPWEAPNESDLKVLMSANIGVMSMKVIWTRGSDHQVSLYQLWHTLPFRRLKQ